MLTYFCYTGKILVFLINFCHTRLFPCHTERSEVSIQKNGEWIAEFMDFSLTLKMTNFLSYFYKLSY